MTCIALPCSPNRDYLCATTPNPSVGLSTYERATHHEEVLCFRTTGNCCFFFTNHRLQECNYRTDHRSCHFVTWRDGVTFARGTLGDPSQQARAQQNQQHRSRDADTGHLGFHPMRITFRIVRCPPSRYTPRGQEYRQSDNLRP